MANRLVCFPSGVDYTASFIELLNVEQPDAVPQIIRNLIGQAFGPMALVFAVADLDACRHTLTKAGVRAAEPIAIRRRWVLPSGEVLDVALDVMIGDEATLPFRWGVVKHHTLRHYLRPAFTSHPRGDSTLRAILISATDPLGVAEKMTSLFGAIHRRTENGAIIDLLNAQLIVINDRQNRASASRSGTAIIAAILQRAVDYIDLDDVTLRLGSGDIENYFDQSELCGLRILSAKNG
jgi:hypothetical protein